MEQKSLSEKLNILREKSKNSKVKIMIIGLGSVGHYLLDYLLSENNENIEIVVVGRNYEKMEMDVNIVNVASIIRRQNKTRVTIDGDVNLDDIESIKKSMLKHNPDIIVNSSRAYAHFKYGAISWTNIRAYGIWTPLAIKYTKNIMEAYEATDGNAIVINTSYSDAVIAWLKSSGKAYPDIGSGNINHLIPRIKMSVAKLKNIEDIWNIEVSLATAHFHDIVISKEGHTEGVSQLLSISYKGEKLDMNLDEVFENCKIVMPTDAKRNMMNASSNYEIIRAILDVISSDTVVRLHCPGAFGEIGGYPVFLDSTKNIIEAYIDQSNFSLDEMRKKNRESIYLDGVENVEDATLYYSDELLLKVKKAFDVELPKAVSFDEIDNTANYIIENIIERFRK